MIARTPCSCGCWEGRIDIRNGQKCIFCAECGRWLYNQPKKEAGEAPETTRTDGISPSLRYRVMERAGFKCEFCGSNGGDKVMHIAHLVSERDLRISGLPPESYRDFNNLAWLCDECNLGMGAKSITPHNALVFMWRRKLEV